MTDFERVIAETEGIVTPTTKRTQADVDAAFESFTEKRKSKKTTAKTEKASREAKGKSEPGAIATGLRKPSDTKAGKSTKSPATAEVIVITREVIAANPGNTTTAGYDASTKTMHVEFSKGNVYEYKQTSPEDWKDLKATFEDLDVVTGNYFRKAFRGRNYARVINPTPAAAPAAPVKSEVSK